jgi:hypothetical protein
MKRMFSSVPLPCIQSPGLKLFCLLVLLFAFATTSCAQRIFFENFGNKTLSEAWHKISGDWKIESVQDMKIAPAENGNEFVLCGQSDALIRLIVNIPDSVRASKIRFRFSYYTYSKGASASLEIEFHKRQQKDGAKGKLFKTALPVKGKWATFEKQLPIPSGANSVYLVFQVNKATAKGLNKVCFDVITISALK